MHDHNEEKDNRPAKPEQTLIFTHGSGGDLNADAMLHFRQGFATQLPIVCFQGNMNLTSRVKMFNAVAEAQADATCLGGRSMGARAAVMAMTESTDRLILVSYPLHTAKDLRDAILLALPPTIKVIFVCGERDAMCDLDRLEKVRDRMKGLTWRVIVRGADHGMKIKPKSKSADVVQKSGEVVAAWITHSPEDRREGTIAWDGEKVAWSGWCAESPSPTVDSDPALAAVPRKARKRTRSSTHDDSEAQVVASRTRKRRKV